MNNKEFLLLKSLGWKRNSADKWTHPNGLLITKLGYWYEVRLCDGEAIGHNENLVEALNAAREYLIGLVKAVEVMT